MISEEKWFVFFDLIINTLHEVGDKTTINTLIPYKYKFYFADRGCKVTKYDIDSLETEVIRVLPKKAFNTEVKTLKLN